MLRPLLVIIASVLFLFHTEIQADPRKDIAYPGVADKDHISWFIQITDIHVGKNGSATDNLGWIRDTAYPNIDPDFVTATGDLVESVGWFGCCINQEEDEWLAYYDAVNASPFADNYYDLPGNHDRYGDPEWDGQNGNDGYANKSIRGSASDPMGQFSWTESNHLFLGTNTCDETGESMDLLSFRSDLPQLSQDEIQDLEAELTAFRDNPSSALAFVLGHASIFTRPGHDLLPGLYEPAIDAEDLNARGAEDFIELLNTYRVSAYIFGHTHENTVFLDQGIEGFDAVSAVQINTGSLVDEGEDTEVYRIIAIDNGGVSTTTASLREWPVILITAPVDKYLSDGEINPYSRPVPKSRSNPIRALCFENDGECFGLKYRIVGSGFDGDWAIMGPVQGTDNLYQGIWDASEFPPGAYTIYVADAAGITVESIEVDLFVSLPWLMLLLGD